MGCDWWQQRCETMYQHVSYTPIVDNQIELFDHRFSQSSLRSRGAM